MNNVSENRNFGFFLLAVIAMFLSVLYTSQATTIGTNVSVSGTLASTGNATLSGTLAVTGTSAFTGDTTFNGDLNINKTTETAVSFGTAGINFDSNTLVIDPSNNRVGVGSSTPITEFGVQSAATTTISIGSTGSNSGGCIQLKGTDGINFRIYATASTSITKQLHVEAGNCK
ncbi:hypothetical protein A3I27_00080 [Candidatus Giovannonibacteria bacterium RIFCSPLOWO2_02_FULL_43_11b]|nr:MAG: hypothetical protein A3B97_01075 [Candidatus Giovannonibacteria bacterium RIFCSPHIGHO2_02_FULL_43_32]OGF90198.1 MAG: hypothetical protein A3I27_00080 [Candidatus Giovannonibacteria bacterium RIFCSPLOWO2_02_FULL_43_11b]OGF92109.1 MAG: hypothetical protein A3H04_03690 [Candidatus Giovannonibacteria bacterium RIFCSPLOWO2_12_FULL_43_11c]